MAGNTLNTVALNSSGVSANVSLLPEALITSGFTLYERISPYLVGTVNFGTDLAGDLAKISTLTASPISMGFEVTGTLEKGLVKFLDGTLGSSFDLSGGLSKVQYFGLHTINSDIALTSFNNTILRTGGLVGEVTLTINTSGSMINRATIPASKINMVFDLVPSDLVRKSHFTGLIESGMDLSGSLTAKVTLQGEVDMGMDWVNPVLSRRLVLSGTVDSSINISGYLANNAYALDLVNATMYRPKTKREMIK